MSWFTDVVRFHHKMGAPIAVGFDTKTLKRRRALIHEEYMEVVREFSRLQGMNTSARGRAPAAWAPKPAESYIEAQQQLCAELIDLIYVVIGTFVEFGVDPTPVWNAVHEANMQKEPHPNGGKAVKPEGWQKPRIVLRSFAGALRRIVGSNPNPVDTSLGRPNVPGAAEHARKLAAAIGMPSEHSVRRRSQTGHASGILAKPKSKRGSTHAANQDGLARP